MEKKTTPEEKIRAIEDYHSGKRSVKEILQELCVSKATLRRWIALYERNGSTGLQKALRHKQYSQNVKMAAVNDYLSGTISLNDVCAKYGISSATSLRDWVKKNDLGKQSKYKEYSDEVKLAAVEDYLTYGLTITEITDKYEISSRTVVRKWLKKYNNHVQLKDQHTERTDRMVKGRKTSLEERIEIALFCISAEKNYMAASEKYQVSYQQVYSWVDKYERLGASGLEDRRGKAKSAEALTETEALRAENKLLASKLKQAEMENELLKKVRSLERGRR